MYLIRKLKTFDVDKKMLEMMYRSLVESILTLNIVTFYGHHTVKQKNRLNKIVNFTFTFYRCSLSDTTLDTMVLHSSLLVAISAHLFMFIPAYRETFPSHPHLFLPRPRLPFTMPSVIIRCRLSCLLTCP